MNHTLHFISMNLYPCNYFNHCFGFQVSVEKKRKITQHEPSEYTKAMRELWLPSVETVRNVPSRQVMGYVAQGAFSFTEARSCGIGYIAYNALNHLLNKGLNQVLVRNTTSRKYRLANIVIVRNT